MTLVVCVGVELLAEDVRLDFSSVRDVRTSELGRVPDPFRYIFFDSPSRIYL